MRFRGLDLNLLVVLDAVLAEQSISGAAERLNLSQPAVSGLMRKLRDYFQDDLLIPVGRRMIRTQRGEALVEAVRDALLHIDMNIASPRDFDPAVMQREVSLIASDYLVSVLLAPAINTLAKSAPRVTFLLKPLDEQAVKRLHNGEADLLLVPKEHGATDLPSRDLFSDDYVGIGDEANPHLRDGLSLADYQALGHVGVQLGHGAFRNFDIWLRQNYGIARRVEVTTLSFNSVPMLVLGNNRIATLPRRLARLYAQTIPLRLVDLPFDRPASTHVVQWHGSRDRDAGLQWIIDQLVEAAHRQKA